MKTTIDNFKTGWHGISLGLKPSEIGPLIQNLIQLRDGETSHFHARSDFSGVGGIADIEFSLETEDSKDDMTLDYSKAIFPSK